MVSHSRRRVGTTHQTRQTKKATFLLSEDLLREVDAVVAAGVAPSKNAFIERAIDRELAEGRRVARRARLEAASQDPLFLADITEVERDFRYADSETAPESG